jgi:hypothetical protein
MGAGKKATAKTSCCNIHNATTPVSEEPTAAEILARAWVQEHVCQQEHGKRQMHGRQ